MNPEFEILSRKVGESYPPLVISEIGINHGGSLETAFEMVDAAHKSGAEIIKHQTHVVEDEMTKEEALKVIPGNANISIYEIMKSCSLSEIEEYELMKYVNSKGMIFISTPFSHAALDRLKKFDLPAYKIGSGECNNYPLIEDICRLRKPIIVSTGMNSISSIRKTVDLISSHKVPYALLHCTNVYPTPPSLVRLGAITELKANFPDAVVGLSDHTTDNFASLGAVALGASILERHFTDSKTRQGPDIICSMDGNELKELIKGANTLFLERGGSKGPVAEEQPTIDFAFGSVVAKVNIKKGETFSKRNIKLRRPNTGDFGPDDFYSLIGKVARSEIQSGCQISFDDVNE